MTELPNRRRIDQINDMWREDAPFSTDPLKLPEESSRTLSDLQKYQDLKTVEQRKLRILMKQTEAFHFRLVRFYRDGVSDPNDPMAITAFEHQWELPPEGKPHIKSDVRYWVDSNPDMVAMALELAEQNDVIELIDEIIKSLHNRTYAINETMKMVRWNNGSSY